jgi:hypothetical protein
MYLGPGICLFMGRGVQHWLRRLGHDQRRVSYRVVALLLLIVAMGGAARDLALRAREREGPGIRSTLVDADGLVGADGQFVVLNPRRPITGETSQVFAYYMSRYVAKPIYWNGEISPSQARSGSSLAVVAVTTEPGGSDVDPFGRFEKRFGKPITRTWTQAARISAKTGERVRVRIYRVGLQTADP